MMTPPRPGWSGLILAGILASVGCRSSLEPVIPPLSSEGSTTPGTPAGNPVSPGQQESHLIDLRTSLRMAAGVHLDILEARARVREAEGNVTAADGYLLPILILGGSWGRTEGQTQASFGNLGQVNFGTITALGTAQLATNVGQSIYHDLAAHQIASAAGEFELAQIQRTLLDVSQDYLALVEGDAIVRINQQLVQEAQGLVRYTAARELQGLGPALDTERARTQAADAEQRLIVAQNDRQRRSKKLSAALRLDSAVDLVPVDRDLSPATLVGPADTMQQWLSRAAEHRPETRAYRASQEAAAQEASAARWGTWGPQLFTAVQYGGIGSSPSNVAERESWVAGLGWTLSFGGPGRIQSADARAEQATIQLLRFQDRLQASVAGAYQEVVLSRQRLDPADRELASAEKALRLALVNFQGGLLPENDLLFAQQAADQARQSRLTAVTRFNLSQLELVAEAGIASVDTLGPAAGK